MSSPNIKNSKLKDLDLKLKNVRDKKSELKSDNQAFKSAHVGWRMVLELVIGILIGVVIGFCMDSFFNTSPIFFNVKIL